MPDLPAQVEEAFGWWWTDYVPDVAYNDGRIVFGDRDRFLRDWNQLTPTEQAMMKWLAYYIRAGETQLPVVQNWWARTRPLDVTQSTATITLNPEVQSMTRAIRQIWTFRSDTSPDTLYETLQYTDASASCNCKGWTRQVKADGKRTCKHTRYIEQNIADNLCVSTVEYLSNGKTLSRFGGPPLPDFSAPSPQRRPSVAAYKGGYTPPKPKQSVPMSTVRPGRALRLDDDV